MSNKAMFVAWIHFQRRAFSMQSYFNFDLFFVKNRFKNKRYRVFDYLAKSFYTIFLLLREKPQVLWFQLPPTPLIAIASIYKRINKKCYIIADCHNAIISKKWTKYFKDYSKLNVFDAIIVHNHVISEIVKGFSVDSNKLFVLETKPASKNLALITNLIVKQKQVLMPCSFADDEPLDIVFKAAQLIPEITILISGNKHRAKGIHNLTNIPKNVKLIGYLSVDEYEKIFLESAAVIGLTTKHHIQLSVANEAVGFGKPMILSDTPLLRELFYKGATYVDTFNEESLANGINECLAKLDILSSEINILKKERLVKWESQAAEIQSIIENK